MVQLLLPSRARGEFDATIAAHEILQQRGGQALQVEAGRRIQVHSGIEIKELRGLYGAEIGEHLRMLQFADSIAGHGKCSHTIQADLGMPVVGRESSELKFDGQSRAAGRGQAVDVGVDAVGKRGQDCERIRGVAFIFGLHVAPITQSARVHVAGQSGRPQNLGEPSLARSFPKLHLKKPVLSCDGTLGEKQVMLVAGVNVGDTPVIAQDVDVGFKAFKVQMA